jgi:hypothetical protein
MRTVAVIAYLRRVSVKGACTPAGTVPAPLPGWVQVFWHFLEVAAFL